MSETSGDESESETLGSVSEIHMDASDKNPERVAAGLKASVHNPHVSEAAKERARERLAEMGVDPQSTASSGNDSTGTGTYPESVDESSNDAAFASGNTGNVLGGYKATLKNPRVSSEAKEHAKEVLEENDAM